MRRAACPDGALLYVRRTRAILVYRIVYTVSWRHTPPQAIWERLYVGTAMNGRRGLIIHAMGALDMALWDIKGKAAGKPCWEPNPNSYPNPNPNQASHAGS